jgi:hypothetical protein
MLGLMTENQRKIILINFMAPTRRGTEDRDNGQDHLLVTGPGGSDLKPVTMTVNSEINPTSLNFEFIRSIPVERHIVPRQITVQKFSEA